VGSKSSRRAEQMHAQYLVLPAGVGNGVELWLGEGEAHSARPICPVSLPRASTSWAWTGAEMAMVAIVIGAAAERTGLQFSGRHIFHSR
jgi:hypothetical protein